MLISHRQGDHLVDRIRKLFGEAPCRLQVAALPWRKVDGKIEVMMITSRDTGRWVLPKGWPEPHEPLGDAAAREAGEEAGIKGLVTQREIGRYFYAKGLATGEDIACEVRVFPLKVKRVTDKWKESRQRQRQWMSGGEAAAMVHERDLAELIATFCDDGDL